ncbi:hypothetical protein CQP30_17220 [Yersinia pestis]|uniref:Uncharacterized protein n=1 Tax=Yersinia pestis TaxID=632 RepID=A0A384KIK3_YERPE|nr:hypothetical protein BAY22_02425 [Yersinia pestis]EDM39712.1 hypothetical protein YPE_2519 [Yersinia pestis CA88-4125]EEO82127.1 hypothetical protein YPF_1147 [Yersinia pestis biovar Orientalis str. India 195]EEO87058.1 hypothetical protein YPH_2991 [Yersinia pestis biovar Orientalis str. PEXU2]EEO91567.1 hypothetical protein YPS_1350 [Yersinia pestis Pestoides A]KJG84458.1 hypothetical protein RN23_13630 [Yersinia pestis subsp. microtus bv. Ulegeica]KKM53385.1 hypothetical protein KD37_03
MKYDEHMLVFHRPVYIPSLLRAGRCFLGGQFLALFTNIFQLNRIVSILNRFLTDFLFRWLPY